MKQILIKSCAALIIATTLLSGCSLLGESDLPLYTEAECIGDIDIYDEAVALAASPAPEYDILTPEASGKAVKKNDAAIIDYSNAADGYVMVCYTIDTKVKLKARVKCDDTTYTYNINPKEWATFPLSEGDGEYTVTVYANVKGTKYATVISQKIKVKLEDDHLPFLYPNQYVDYANAPKTVEKAAELVSEIEEPLEMVAEIYDYVIKTLKYDKKKAETVASGYIPVLDDVLEEKKGICFDYATLMAGMLRSVGVPCKLVVGYAGEAYHAWINVWSEDTGWIDGFVFFDGKQWQRMDPTFASSSNKSASIMKYIGNGKNYTEKYLY